MKHKYYGFLSETKSWSQHACLRKYIRSWQSISATLSKCLSYYLPVCDGICLFICLPVSLTVCPSVIPSAYLSDQLTACRIVCHTVSLPIWQSLCVRKKKSCIKCVWIQLEFTKSQLLEWSPSDSLYYLLYSIKMKVVFTILFVLLGTERERDSEWRRRGGKDGMGKGNLLLYDRVISIWKESVSTLRDRSITKKVLT
jgi:hypothetical protein